MQELIEQLQYHFANESRGDFFDASKYLEKEKEQIEIAYTQGTYNLYVCDEDYYNQTYKK